MINALCPYQVVYSFAQCELCLSKQVRGRRLFITVKVADTDQESINLPALPPRTPPPLPMLPLTGVLCYRLEASEPSSTLIPSTLHRNLLIWKAWLKQRARLFIMWACKPHPSEAKFTPLECKGQSSHPFWYHPSWQRGHDDSGDL